MHARRKAALAGIAAALLLSVAVSTASANRLSLSNRSFRTTWSSLEFFTIAGTMRCPITMEGSFHSNTFSKVVGALIGYVSRATALTGACTGGTLSVEQTSLPWHVRYRGFGGALPEIAGVGLGVVNAKFRATIAGLTCTAQTTVERPWAFNAELVSGRVTGITPEEAAEIPLRGAFLCEIAGNAQLGGTGTMTLLGSTTAISITLIGGTPPFLSPGSVEFGRVEPERLERRTVTITAGSEMLVVNGIGMAAGQYFGITDPNRCIGARVAAMRTCAFTVIFAAPSEAGRSSEDTVTVETNARTLRDTVRGST